MDPERVPVLSRSEIIAPIHASGEDTPGTIRADPFGPFNPNVPRPTARVDTSNLGPYAGHVLPSESPSSEKMESIQSPLPAHLPEFNSGMRDTNVNDERFPNPSTQMHNGIDWIVPTSEAAEIRHTVGERLQPTLEIAILEKEKYTAKAKWTGYTLNAAIGLQVLLGSLTTGLSAVAASGGKSTAAATTALGALATLVASYLARARGSNEPELSITRTKDLEQFIRECRAFQMDHGHLHGTQFDPDIIRLRRRFEELLGNANGERKLAPV